MKVGAVLGVALRSLQRAPVRSSLTALGVIVGVAAVVATASIGSGARAKIEETLTKPESRIIFLGATVPRAKLRKRDDKLPPGEGLNPEDYYAIRSEVSNLAAISPRISLSNAKASANGRAFDISVEGTAADGFRTNPRTLLRGELFNELDVKRATSVCVISESLAAVLLPGEHNPNRTIRLNEVSFKVIGIVDDVTPQSGEASSLSDLRAYVPFTSLLHRLDTTAQISVLAQATDIAHVQLVRRDIGDIMEQRRSGRKAEFLTNDNFESLKTYAEGSLAVARLLAGVGAIALIVGGIGIMNIMLVSVSERTREIGVRMAVGTRHRDILRQFLVEAIALSLLGGGLGIVIGWSASLAITRLNDWPTAVTWDSVMAALVCSLGVGVLFGYHPARRAAMMRPVEALGTEH
jgi:putative ABC transport system permease protein